MIQENNSALIKGRLELKRQTCIEEDNEKTQEGDLMNGGMLPQAKGHQGLLTDTRS